MEHVGVGQPRPVAPGACPQAGMPHESVPGLETWSGPTRRSRRSYEKAVRAIGGYPADLSYLDVAGLKRIPGVGKSITEKVVTAGPDSRPCAPVVPLGQAETRTLAPDGLVEQVARLLTAPPRRPKLCVHVGAQLRLGSEQAQALAVARSVPTRARYTAARRLGKPLRPVGPEDWTTGVRR